MNGSADPKRAAAIQKRLRLEITNAREAYEFARLEFEEASQQAHELGLNTSDGVHALFVAAARYKYYLRQYNYTVKRLVSFLRTGSDPDLIAANLDRRI